MTCQTMSRVSALCVAKRLYLRDNVFFEFERWLEEINNYIDTKITNMFNYYNTSYK